MQQINWNQVAERAKTMTDGELWFAAKDCAETAAALGPGEYKGKDQAYYLDEASVYRAEIARRLKPTRKGVNTP